MVGVSHTAQTELSLYVLSPSRMEDSEMRSRTQTLQDHCDVGIGVVRAFRGFILFCFLERFEIAIPVFAVHSLS